MMPTLSGCLTRPRRTPSGALVSFVWSSVSSATSYQIDIGTTHDGTEDYTGDVGNVLTHSLWLSTGVHYARVRGAVSTGWAVWTDHQEVTV
jgi:hypothetical protein